MILVDVTGCFLGFGQSILSPDSVCATASHCMLSEQLSWVAHPGAEGPRDAEGARE